MSRGRAMPLHKLTALGIKPAYLVYGAAFASQFIIAKLVLINADLDWYGGLTLFASVAVAARICWFGVLGPATALHFAQAKHLPMSVMIPQILAPIALLGIMSLIVWLTAVPFDIHTIVAGGVFAIALGLCSAFIEVFNAQGRTGHVVYFMILPSAVQLTCSLVIGLFALSPADFALICGLLILVLSLPVISCRGLFDMETDLFDKSAGVLARTTKTMFKWVPANLLLRFFDKWIVAAILTISDVAIFGFLMLLTQGAMSAFASLLQRVAQPTLFGALPHHQKIRTIKHALKLTFITSVTLVGCSLLFGATIIGFFAPSLVVYAAFLPLLFGGAGAGAATHLLAQFAMAAHKFEVVTWSKFGEALLYSFLLVGCLPLWGIAGGFVAYAIAAIVGLGIQLMGQWHLLSFEGTAAARNKGADL